VGGVIGLTITVIAKTPKTKKTRHLMSDNGTLKDHLEDLMRENQELRSKLRVFQRVASQAFTKADGHIEPCLKAMMCSCGYTQYLMISEE